MAGALAVVAGEQLPVGSVIGYWEVRFSRFFALASRPSACPSLVPLRDSDRRRLSPSGGTWLSSSSKASLQLQSGPPEIITVCLSGKLLKWMTRCLNFDVKVTRIYVSSGFSPFETWQARATFLEALLSFLTRHSFKFKFSNSPLLMNFVEHHLVSKLQFFRPQLSYMSEFPAMASRAVLVSYRDCRNECMMDVSVHAQIQKFALRFSTTYEANSFTNSLKEILKDATETELQTTHVASQISAHSEFTSYSPYRVQEEKDAVSCTGIQNPENLSTLENVSQLFSSNEETACDRDAENGLASFPPSFTSFLTSCCADRKQATAQSTIPEVVDLKSQIMKYMEDSEFQEMLIRVDRVINEIGG